MLSEMYTDLILDPADRGIGPNVGYQSKVRVIDRYKVIGFISSGTYGRVYKAIGRHGQTGQFAIKKFKPGRSPVNQFREVSDQKSQTRKESKSNTQGSPNPQSGKWPFVPS
jgi:hypothetical protein